jgi:hypothetical protein
MAGYLPFFHEQISSVLVIYPAPKQIELADYLKSQLLFGLDLFWPQNRFQLFECPFDFLFAGHKRCSNADGLVVPVHAKYTQFHKLFSKLARTSGFRSELDVYHQAFATDLLAKQAIDPANNGSAWCKVLISLNN